MYIEVTLNDDDKQTVHLRTKRELDRMILMAQSITVSDIVCISMHIDCDGIKSVGTGLGGHLQRINLL